ncbi:MAG: hypothetical protein ACR2RE_20050 [Geminicoccaceae bacterium]
MVRPIAPKLIAFQAERFRKEFKSLVTGNGQGPNDGVGKRVEKLEVEVFHLQHRDSLARAGMTTPQDLAALGKAKAAERKKRFEALDVEEDGFSRDDFDRMCKLAAEVL